MARRYTDDKKWTDEWWGSLPNDSRMIWLYLIDSCTLAGRWKKDIRGLNFNCNTNIVEDDLKKICGNRLVDCGSFFFIPGFVRFQNPSGLASKKPVVLSIIKEIIDNNLIDIIKERFPNDYPIIIGKGKGKGRGIGKGTKQERDPEIQKKENQLNSVVETEIDELLTHLNQFAGTFFKLETEPHRKVIRSAIKAGLKVNEGREVIECMCMKWKGSDMEQHLTPETLFKPKNLPKYLAEVERFKITGTRPSSPKINGMKNANLKEQAAFAFAKKHNITA